MKKPLLGLLLFIAAFAVFVIATLPARFALQYLPASLPLQLYGVDGTIWRGEAQQAVWQHQPVGRLRWRLHPLPLLLGRLRADVEIDGEAFTARGRIDAHRDQTIIVRNAIVDADLARLPLPRNLMATPGGKGHADIHHARIENRWPVELDADLRWQPARLLAPFELSLGRAELELGSNGNVVSGDLRGSGALESNGRLTLSRNGAFSADLTIAPTDETPRELRDMLPMLGRPDSRGAVTVRQAMQLRGFPP